MRIRARSFKRTKGRVFVSWSGQNIDRTVSLYRAAKRTGRILAIDLYTADVLDRIAEGTRLPRAGYANLKIVVTKGLGSYYRMNTTAKIKFKTLLSFCLRNASY